MNEFLASKSYFGLFLGLFIFWVSTKLSGKLKSSLANPLLITTVLLIVLLTVLRIDYETFDLGASHLTYFLTPATVALAIPMYKQVSLLKKHMAAIGISIVCGIAANAACILALCLLFGLDAEIYHSLLPKSVTTAIAIGVSTEIGGVPSLTVASVVITGLFGSSIARLVCRIFRIKNPVAIGLACGNSAHAIGTVAALEIGEVEGAMSGLAMVIAGILTAVLIPLAAGFM